MARAIDADAFHEELKEMYDGLNLIYDGLLYGEERNICKGQMGILMECALRLNEQPTIDPVIRCRDCAVPHNKWTGCPKLNGLVPLDNFYCAFGVKKGGSQQ